VADKLGYPVVLKICSADIAHKTEVDGVKLGLQDRNAVLRAATAMAQSVKTQWPQARLDGFLLAQDVRDGLEMVAGIQHDPQFGAMVTLGMGGTLVELLDDVVMRCAPLSPQDASDMIAALRASRLLRGIRGAPAYDADALRALLLKLSDIAMAGHAQLQELEINPVAVLPGQGGVCALDALIVLRQTEVPDSTGKTE